MAAVTPTSEGHDLGPLAQRPWAVDLVDRYFLGLLDTWGNNRDWRIRATVWELAVPAASDQVQWVVCTTQVAGHYVVNGVRLRAAVTTRTAIALDDRRTESSP